MLTTIVVAREAEIYRRLADQLKADFADLDDETLNDTLEGLSELPQMIEGLVRSSLDDEALAAGLKLRLADMAARLSRIQDRALRKRELACRAMAGADMKAVQAEDFSVSLRQGQPRLVVIDEARIPQTFLIPQAPRLDRQGLVASLKAGAQVDGAILEAGHAHISVRTK